MCELLRYLAACSSFQRYSTPVFSGCYHVNKEFAVQKGQRIWKGQVQRSCYQQNTAIVVKTSVEIVLEKVVWFHCHSGWWKWVKLAHWRVMGPVVTTCSHWETGISVNLVHRKLMDPVVTMRCCVLSAKWVKLVHGTVMDPVGRTDYWPNPVQLILLVHWILLNPGMTIDCYSKKDQWVKIVCWILRHPVETKHSHTALGQWVKLVHWKPLDPEKTACYILFPAWLQNWDHWNHLAGWWRFHIWK